MRQTSTPNRLTTDYPELRIANIKKLRQMRKTYREIGRMYDVSGVQIHYWLNGRKISHLQKYPGKCEIFGTEYDKLNSYHIEVPRVGMWLCPRCHMAAEAIDATPEFASKYRILKEVLKSECIRSVKQCLVV